MANRFDLIYGPPGSGKTLAIIKLIEHVHKTTGKIARVYIGDGSGLMYENSGLIDDGVVEMMDFSIRNDPFTVSKQITEGWWPEDTNDPDSKMRQLSTDEVAKTGLWVFEGCAVMGDYMMGMTPGGLAARAAGGEVIGQDANIKFTDKDSGLSFAGNSGAHYGAGQRQLHAVIKRSKRLPGWVIWTTHERINDGEKGGAFARGASGDKTKIDEKTIGPELIGQALTANIARDFGNTLHFTTASKKVQDGQDAITGRSKYKEKTEYRVYTREHYDPDGIVNLKYRAVCRAIDPEKVKDYYAGESPGTGLLDFYEDLSKANSREAKSKEEKSK